MTDLLQNPEPIFRVGGTTKGELAVDALWLCVSHGTEGLRSLEAHFVAQADDESIDDGLLYLDGQVVDFGSQLEVAIGAGDAARTVFKGLVTAIEADFSEAQLPKLVLRAEDELVKLRLSRRHRTYTQKSDAQIAQEIAGLHSLDVQATAEGPTYDYVQQWNQSDLAFLRDRARLIQAELWVADGKLYFESRGSRHGAELTLTRGGDLMDLRVCADLAHQRSKVVVSGYDASKREAVDKNAAADALSAEASGGSTGIDILGRAFPGDRVSYRVRENPQVDGEATAFAKGEMQRRGRAFVTAMGMTNGTPDLDVGSKLTLQRVGQPFNGAGYYVTALRHVWERGVAFRTHFEAERPTVAGR